MTALGAYLQLTKPRLLPLVLFSGLPALVLATGSWPAASTVLVVLGGTALAAGAANTLNSYLERESDARMERTASRPLPSGQLRPHAALGFGLALAALGPGLLWWTAGAAAASIALAAIAFYVFVYTLWLKPRTSAAVVLGGVSGAISPLIADAAIEGTIGLAGWLLFAIIFVWQPPHFWAIALYRREEYAAAGFPMIFDKVGLAGTRRRITLWIAALVPITLAPVPLGLLGLGYGAVALGLGAWFVASAIALERERSDAAARRVFRVSLVYLLGLFVAMIGELALMEIFA